MPLAAQLSTLETVKDELQGKILIDATVPLMPPRVSRVQLPKEGSAVLVAQSLLGEGVRVVSAFQNVSAHHLHDLSHAIETDIIVCGDNTEACDIRHRYRRQHAPARPLWRRAVQLGRG